MRGDDQIAKVMAEMGRRGGLARAKVLTAKERKKSAIKASKAAAKARTRKAKERKAKRRESG
jgi:hypothetical protein